jgi:hypothetical protein
MITQEPITLDKIRNDQVKGFEGDIHAHITWIAFFLIRNGIYSAYQHIETEEVA